LSKYNIVSCLEVEYETHYSKFLMPTIRGSDIGSKKRYAGLIGDKQNYEMIFKGLEAVRSDWSPLAKDFQQELYRRIFLGESYEDFILDTVQQVKTGEADEKLVFRKRLRRKLTEYQKNVPPHVKAARLAETERAKRGLNSASDFGGWIEYLMTVNGAEPKQYRQSRIDYQFYIDKQLAPIADAILSFQSKSLSGIIDQQLSLF
jgi:DNA polymerase-2